MKWTAEELAAMAEADAEIEEDFVLTDEEKALSAELDRTAKVDGRVYASRYYQENRETLLAKQRESRKANFEKERLRNAKYYAANREKIAARKRRWYADNRDAIRERQKKYAEANRDAINARRREKYRKKRKEAERATLDP